MSWKRPRFRSRKGDDTADADDGVADELRNVRHVQDGELLRFFPSFHGVDTPPTCSFSSVLGILYLEGKDVEQNKHCSTTSVQGAMDCQGAHVCARDLRTSMRSSMGRAFMARSTSGALGYFL